MYVGDNVAVYGMAVDNGRQVIVSPRLVVGLRLVMTKLISER